MTQLSSRSRRGSPPLGPITRGVRVVASVDLKRMHLLMVAIFTMEAIDLAINLMRVLR